MIALAIIGILLVVGIFIAVIVYFIYGGRSEGQTSASCPGICFGRNAQPEVHNVIKVEHADILAVPADRAPYVVTGTG